MLHDGYGKRKYSGGDQLRATIGNKELQVSAPCIVIDNRDGTQTVVCEALWSGTSTISVTLAYPRETITAHYRIKTQVLATIHTYGRFKSRSYSEESICHPNHSYLLKHTHNTELCNITYMNSGMPFYCGKPKDKHLLCQDFQFTGSSKPFPELKVSKCEETLLERAQLILKKTIAIDVQKRKKDNNVSFIDKPSITCSMYNSSSLWRSRKPTGFFINGTWHLRHCLGFKENLYTACLRNAHLYLFGDSTTRAWYKTIIERFKCKPITEEWHKEKWHKEAECYNKHINFKAGWYPHAQPFLFGNIFEDVRYTLYSTSRRIDNIPRDERAIIVIHLFVHFLVFHHTVFKQRMQIIRKSVESILENNKKSIVMIKGPHTFDGTRFGGYRFCDYFGYLYSKILFEVFEGLHERVVILNNRDTTIAQPLKGDHHPPRNIVDAMVDQMLSYACGH
ncbi:NXPE family member 4-like [Mercenaria mercenaria]|uniref:NXPE family member 4-like n=1 Tax=Mercenaria mercenaria TaxID=6596 RepID=UPI00234EAC79|nr:NXPE family member 4-like [Mercenaria mercenaria]